MPDIGKLLKPESIVVIGGSNDGSNLRGRLVNTILQYDFDGPIHFVSRSTAEIAGHKTVRSVFDLAKTADLAVLLVPASGVCDVLEDCGKAGIGAALIVASGFAEAGTEEGIELQRRITEIATRFDLAVCGPNSEGFADLGRGLAPTFSPVLEASESVPDVQSGQAGRIAVLAQSGAIGYAFLDAAMARRAPVSIVLTTGNEACLDLVDYLEYMVATDAADVFLLFIEGLKQPALFQKVAKDALAAGKPIIAVKIGRSEVSQKAAASHTGALAGSYAGYAAAFERYGIIEANDIDEAIDLANSFSRHRHRLPAGSNVGILSASGGGGGWVADLCEDNGLNVPVLDQETRDTIDHLIPAYGSSMNPVDVTAQAIRGTGYARFAEIVAASSEVDAVIVVCSARTAATVNREVEALGGLGSTSEKPILFWSYSQPIERTMDVISIAGFPLTTSLRNTVAGIARMVSYRKKREELNSEAPPCIASPESRKDVSIRIQSLPGMICEYQARELLAAYGIGKTSGILATSPAEAASAVQRFAVPCALKIQSPDIPHKTDAGGVALNVSEPDAAGRAYHGIHCAAQAFNPNADIHGVLVEPMASDGHNVVIGVSRDVTFGHLLMVGWGGVHVEIIKDTVFSLLPVNRQQAFTLLKRLKLWHALAGARGAPASDLDALVDLIVRVSEFVADHGDEIDEMDINPVLVHPDSEGVSVVDAMITKRTPRR